MVLIGIIEGHESIVKLGLCLKSYNSNTGSDVLNKQSSNHLKQGVYLFLF